MGICGYSIGAGRERIVSHCLDCGGAGLVGVAVAVATATVSQTVAWRIDVLSLSVLRRLATAGAGAGGRDARAASATLAKASEPQLCSLIRAYSYYNRTGGNDDDELLYTVVKTNNEITVYSRTLSK